MVCADPGARYGLVDFMVAVRLVTSQNACAVICRHYGLSVGEIVVDGLKLEDWQCALVIFMWQQVTEKKLSQTQAAAIFEAFFQKPEIAYHWIDQLRGGRSFLGELLISAGFINYKDLLCAIISGELAGMSTGVCLVARGCITQAMLSAVLKMQCEIRAGLCDVLRATDTLSRTRIALCSA